MDEKTIGLTMLGVVVIIAVVGLILVVPATAKTHQIYPGGVYKTVTVTQYPKGIAQVDRPDLEVEKAMPGYETQYQTVQAS